MIIAQLPPRSAILQRMHNTRQDIYTRSDTSAATPSHLPRHVPMEVMEQTGKQRQHIVRMMALLVAHISAAVCCVKAVNGAA